MPSLNRALGACLAAASLFVSLMASPNAPRAMADRGPNAACSGRLCFKNTPGTKSCFNRGSRAHVSRCFIKRAAAHFGQSRSQALAIAYRESRYNYTVTNSSSGAAGLYQFMPATWHSTPYHKHSVYSPKWASLGAMWMWSKGGYSHWSL
jgi:Transglycosylase SLT domain